LAKIYRGLPWSRETRAIENEKPPWFTVVLPGAHPQGVMLRRSDSGEVDRSISL
jgi:hypothetical protein